MKPRSAILIGLAGLTGLALAAAGCAGGTVVPEARKPIVTSDGLHHMPGKLAGALFLRPDHDIGGYDSFALAPVTVSYLEGRVLSEEQEAELIELLERNLMLGAKQFGIEVKEKPDRCSIRLSADLFDLDLVPAGTNRASTHMVESFGRVTLVYEMRDARTKEALIRFAERRDLGSGVATGSGHQRIERLSRAVSAMFADLAAQMARVVPRTEQPRVTQCQGLIAKAIGLDENS